ncbi:hypothetical protein Hbl1158_14305 [Halobaculum sp. CBA1158]|uniref:hypothetical protein n=1 Tax=Halobaculum sp. CBA1158 TaxID=2904243 RepID=UPI001F46A9AC|nr:hypothetical protein [Halobaculum sp. CBA1158]UIO99678.1 hypothetical protein Hbl1158_14305 [Halobaculum sp. CBA1158]
MVTVTDFVVRLVTSVLDLVVIFVTDVALRDPLSFVSFLFGALFVGGASLVLGYLALGALGYEFGIGDPASESRYDRAQRSR